MHREKTSCDAFNLDELFSIYLSLKYFRDTSNEMIKECPAVRVMSKEETEDIKGMKKTLKSVDSSLAKIEKMFRDVNIHIPSTGFYD